LALFYAGLGCEYDAYSTTERTGDTTWGVAGSCRAVTPPSVTTPPLDVSLIMVFRRVVTGTGVDPGEAPALGDRGDDGGLARRARRGVLG
jgi:hypothetical protein